MEQTVIIEGKTIAAEYLSKIKAEVSALKRQPVLSIIWIGNNSASEIYVRNKIKKSAEVGIKTKLYHLPDDIKESKLIKLVTKLSKSKRINGILVQLPLPSHIDDFKVINAISPLKDVDGFTPENIGKLTLKQNCLIPCTPAGCLELLKRIEPNLAGLNALVIGRSKIVGHPMAELLLNENCTVTIAHTHTQNLPELCLNADILVVACGKSDMVRGSWIKQGAIVLDVGISYNQDKQIKGDVRFDEMLDKAKAITPVPGGVGPMTIAMLMSNTIKAYKLQHKA